MRKFFPGLTTLFCTALLSATTTLATDNAPEQESFSDWLFSISRHKEFAPVSNPTWAEECSACHFAYPPGLLPSASWNKLLTATALSDHFGENAELDADTLKTIHDYAVANAAETSYMKRSRKIAHATADGDAPLRITDIKYIKRIHHEIPAKMITGNDKVKSLSQCNSCHTQADKGVFDDDTVRIPGYENWDD
jgi:hypothetical protein